MPEIPDWQIPPHRQPKADEVRFDLDRALQAVVSLSATVPADAYTAETLGTDRGGHGVHIGDNMVLTIGYLLTEAEDLWITRHDGSTVQGHVLGVDQATGFGLVLALGDIGLPALELGESARLEPGDNVIVAGAGGARHTLSAVVVGRQEFAGYWEYLVEEAIFTAPTHPLWGGAPVIGPDGRLVGIGSLQVEGVLPSGSTGQINMIVPIDILKPILKNLARTGQSGEPVRPWLGLYFAEVDGHVFVAATAPRGPGAAAGLQSGDMIVEAAGEEVSDLASLYRRVWSLGEAGVEVPLTVVRDGETVHATVTSSDRRLFLKGPRMHS